MSSDFLDTLFDAAINGLDTLERARSELHETLQHARFALSATQREMDRVGLLLAWPAVPTAPGAIQPTLTVSRTASDHLYEEGSEMRDGAHWNIKEARDLSGRDPALWFASSPSDALIDCQERFRSVVRACVRSAVAQEEALSLAMAYRDAKGVD
ncbi:hypothetical protein TRVL_04049 [Trypanosoma vivax]|nr:hypothetical protein TRVL_04049 [Trypanosoma vivax]